MRAVRARGELCSGRPVSDALQPATPPGRRTTTMCPRPLQSSPAEAVAAEMTWWKELQRRTGRRRVLCLPSFHTRRQTAQPTDPGRRSMQTRPAEETFFSGYFSGCQHPGLLSSSGGVRVFSGYQYPGPLGLDIWARCVSGAVVPGKVSIPNPTIQVYHQ